MVAISKFAGEQERYQEHEVRARDLIRHAEQDPRHLRCHMPHIHESQWNRCQVQIFYTDEGYCSRSQKNVFAILALVKKDPEMTTRSAQLAKKILKYRNMLHLVDAIDIDDPAFDASLFFGVEWTKVGGR